MPAMTSTERIFLRMERPGYPFDIAALILLEPSADGPLPFEQVRALFRQRGHRMPHMTRVIAPAPLGIGDERWAQVTDIDVDAHLEAASVPEPGDVEALLRTVVDLTAEPLDRKRPLWRGWYLTGMADGTAALLVRIHHATADGVGLMLLTRVLFDAEPTPIEVDREPPALSPRAGASTLRRALYEVPTLITGQVGTTARLAGRVGSALSDVAVDVPVRVGRTAGAKVGGWLLRRPEPAQEPLLRLPDLPGFIPSPTSHPPVTLFNKHVEDPRKSMAVASLPLADVKQVRAAFPGVTVNDVLLALVTGSLRDYLAAHQELPDAPLRTTLPVNLRATDPGSRPSNDFTTMWVDLPVHLKDPVERLRTVSANANGAKKSLRESQAYWDALADVGDLLLPGVLTAVVGFAGSRAFSVIPPTQNLTMSTVVGSSEPLYVGTRKISHLYARTIICPPIHLFFSSVTYDGKVDFSITTVEQLCPDPERLGDGLRAELDRLLEASRKTTADARRARPVDVGRA